MKQNKEEQFREAVIKFKNSDQRAEDYFDFIVVSRRVLMPDAGLVWSQIEEILAEVITDKKSMVDPCTTCDSMSIQLCEDMGMGKCPEKRLYEKRKDESKC